MQLTLLQIVQDMLTSIDAQNVTDVSETEEASMCVNIANRSYEEMMSGYRWKHLREFTTLSSTAVLNELTLPSGTIAIDPNNIYYDTQTVQYMDYERFMNLTIKRDTSASEIELIGTTKCYNDRDPQYYTTYDDFTLVFDAVPDNVSGLDTSVTSAIVWRVPTSRKTDDGDVFDLPTQAFPALSLLCQSKAMSELKGDTQEGARIYREYVKAVASLARNARVIDIIPDRRKWIVPRNHRVYDIPPRIVS